MREPPSQWAVPPPIFYLCGSGVGAVIGKTCATRSALRKLGTRPLCNAGLAYPVLSRSVVFLVEMNNDNEG